MTKPNRIIKLGFALLLMFFLSFIRIAISHGDETPASKTDRKEPAKIRHYEFEELVIKIKIQEPDVLFILDKPSIAAEPFDEEMVFLEKIDDPILKDNLF